MTTIFFLGVFCGIIISALFVWCVIKYSEDKRIKIHKYGKAVTAHWYSNVTRAEMKNYVN